MDLNDEPIIYLADFAQTLKVIMDGIAEMAPPQYILPAYMEIQCAVRLKNTMTEPSI